MAAKILIIEDNVQNRYLFSYLLRNQGYEVIEAVNGIEGLKLAGEHQPDLILLDIQLPDIDGYEVADRLRDNAILGSTPIVAVTSYAMSGDREKAIDSGCTSYIEKPIDPKTFLKEIQGFLEADNQEE